MICEVSQSNDLGWVYASRIFVKVVSSTQSEDNRIGQAPLETPL